VILSFITYINRKCHHILPSLTIIDKIIKALANVFKANKLAKYLGLKYIALSKFTLDIAK